MFDVQGFILVGGASRRMGQDKAQLRLGAQTILERIAAELSPVTSSVTLVGSPEAYAGHSLPTVPDVYEKWGALGGIHAALSAAKTDWIIVIACDLPFVKRDLFEWLKSFVADSIDSIVPMQADGRPQPVCALYRRETCLPEIERLISAGEHTPRALLANVRTRYVEFSELGDLRGAENYFLNLNTPGDLERARWLVEIGDSL
ncbi:MAG TPA: molybdenum cofactor guanylyltransferase [Pyrinomonadaceae bacterium]|nr:molybdenum cofactor guanylyltransferase [Pyrinomonadaceae bacterium]